jgi:hypothetical protein
MKISGYKGWDVGRLFFPLFYPRVLFGLNDNIFTYLIFYYNLSLLSG